MTDCRQCGDCCRYALLPCETTTADYIQWMTARGFPLVYRYGRFYARIDQPCPHLAGDLCGIEDHKPTACRDYLCPREAT